ncbi:MAG: hypothetical protein WKG07_50300 [Hymenobacter sp.]
MKIYGEDLASSWPRLRPAQAGRPDRAQLTGARRRVRGARRRPAANCACTLDRDRSWPSTA